MSDAKPGFFKRLFGAGQDAPPASAAPEPPPPPATPEPAPAYTPALAYTEEELLAFLTPEERAALVESERDKAAQAPTPPAPPPAPAAPVAPAPVDPAP